MTAARRKREKGLGEAINERVAELDSSLEYESRWVLGMSANQLYRWTQLIEPKGEESIQILIDWLGVSQQELGGLILEDRRRRWVLDDMRKQMKENEA